MRLTAFIVFALVVIVLGMIVKDAVDDQHLPTVPVVTTMTTTSTTAIPAVFDPPISDNAATPPVVVERPEIPRAHETAPIAAGAITIASTGYCETGRMANGVPAHDGAVSSHVLARGTSWRVLDGQFAGRVFTVEDTGPLATFDIAMPGRCADAVAYGRHTIHIEAA